MVKTERIEDASPGRLARVLVVEDHPVVRNCFVELIQRQPDMRVSGDVADADEAMQLLRAESVDVAIIDLTLRRSSGLELCKRIKSRYPNVKMLVVSAHDESVFARRVLNAGASGYISKEEDTERILTAIRTVLQGRVFLSERMTTEMLRRVIGAEAEDADTSAVSQLSDRELEVLELIGRGMTARQIAARMHLSPKTIESYRENLKKKLPVKNSAELTRFAVEWVLHGH